MKRVDVEEWAFRVLDRVRSRQPTEDSLVELKSTWPAARDIARQLGAHANAARGQPVMWLFGVDERAGIVPFQPQDPATWRDQLAREFDGFAPPFDHYNLELAGETFTAVVFETDAAPFVILNPNRGQPSSGPFEREVPWREGRTRSATRSEVIMIARPPARLPIVEVVAGRATITDTSTSPLHNWDVDITFYGVSETLSRMFFPAFGVHAHIETAAGERIEFRNFGLGPVGEDPHVVFSHDNQLMIDGAARFRFYGTARTEAAPNPIN